MTVTTVLWNLRGNKLSIKKPTLLEALFFILNKSTADLESGTKYSFKRVAPDYNEDGAKDDSPKKKAKTGTRKSLQFPSGSAMTYRDLQDTAASNLHLEKRPYSCCGGSGKIGIGLINGQQVAVKIARKYTKEAEALLVLEADCSKELNQLNKSFEKNCIRTVTQS